MSKKYTQPSTSVVPGGMILDEMREAEEQAKELFNECGFQYKEKAKQNVSKLKVKGRFNTNHMLIDNPSESNSDFTKFDEWMNNLVDKNGTTEY